MNYQPYTYLIRFKPTGQLYYGSSYANYSRKVAHPSEILVTYFTSSDVVNHLIQEYGLNSFEIVSTRSHNDAKSTVLYEQRYLRKVNAKNNPLFLNKSNGGHNIGGDRGPKEKVICRIEDRKEMDIRSYTRWINGNSTKSKPLGSQPKIVCRLFDRLEMSIARYNRWANGNIPKGKPRSEEAKNKQRISMKGKYAGKKQSAEHIQNARNARSYGPRPDNTKQQISKSLSGKPWSAARRLAQEKKKGNQI